MITRKEEQKSWSLKSEAVEMGKLGSGGCGEGIDFNSKIKNIGQI